MHLINCRSLELEHFTSEYHVRYAILSHRWETEEPTFQEFQDLNSCGNKKGVRKIILACQQALINDYQYVWIDTVCIDKTSSAALSEAINSMFRWYQMAQVCYVYLSDVNIVQEGQTPAEFDRSAWFSRAWTLQELLAPQEVVFLDSHWRPFGTRMSLYDKIATISGIESGALLGDTLESFSIAERMSWAANREATRVEDVAYSLMGLFDVNMPMLYGEGPKAFGRLQEEILRKSSDQTLFAWHYTFNSGSPKFETGLLAPSPAAFGSCRGLKAAAFDDTTHILAVTNRGIEAYFGLKEMTDGIFQAMLHAVDTKYKGRDEYVGIYLEKERGPGNRYVRTTYRGDHLWKQTWQFLSKEFHRKTRLYVNEAITWNPLRDSSIPFPRNSTLLPPAFSRTRHFTLASFLYGTKPGKDLAAKVVWNKTTSIGEAQEEIVWNSGTSNGSTTTHGLKLGWSGINPVCTVNLIAQDSMVKLIHFGFDNDLRPVCLIADITYAQNKYLELDRKHAELQSLYFDKLPDPDKLKEATIASYSPNLPWSGHSYTGLVPQTPHCGLWAAIGNSQQTLRFRIDSRAITCWPPNQTASLARDKRRLESEYTLDIQMVVRSRGTDYSWDAYIHEGEDNT